MVRHLCILLAAAGVLLVGAPAYPRCDTETLTASGATNFFNVESDPGAASAWLVIGTAGSGTVSVQARIYGPQIASGGAESATGRATAILGTLNGANTFTAEPAADAVAGMQATLSGCTNCSVTVTLCKGMP